MEAGGHPPASFSFARVAAGAWLAYASYGVLIVILPFAELNLGGGPFLAALVLGAPLASQTLASYGWGWLSDRRGDRRVLLVVATAAQAPLFLLFPLSGAIGVFAVRIVQSALFGAVVLATTVATEEPGRTAGPRLGWLQFATNGGMLLGALASLPLLAGATFRLDSPAGWAVVGFLAVVTGAAALVFAVSGDVPRTVEPPAASSPSGSEGPGRRVVVLAAATWAVATFRYVAVSAVPIYLSATLAAQGFFGLPTNEDQQLAIWLAVSSLINLGVAPFSGRAAEPVASRRRVLVLSAGAYAVLWAVLFARPDYVVTFAVWVAPVAVFFTVAGIREATEASRRIERGRAVGLMTAAFNLGGLTGSLVAGSLLASGVSLRSTFGWAALGCFAAALVWIPVAYRRAAPRFARTSGS